MNMTRGTPASSQIVWLTAEVERLTAENERLRHALLGLPGGGYALEQIVMRGKGET